MSNTYTMETDDSEFWFNNLNVLFKYDKLDKFIPLSNMNYEQKINAIVRLGIYSGIIFSILNKNYLYLYIPICIMIFTYILYLLQRINFQSNKKIEHLKNIVGSSNDLNDTNNTHSNTHSNGSNNHSNGSNNHSNTHSNGSNNNSNTEVLSSTVNNPFLNPDPFSSRKIKSHDNILAPTTQKTIETNFNKHLFKNASDIFNHGNGFRQFYSVPGNTFPNNRDTFMKWCYKRPPSCKEGNGQQCYKNVKYDLTANSFDSRNY